MIEMKELLGSHNLLTDCNQDQRNNLTILLDRINKIRAAWGNPMTVTSGFRDISDMKRIYNGDNYPKGSKHLNGQACDIADPDGKLREWVLSNLQLMKDVGFWFEDFRYTNGWVHFQIVSPASGKRIFIPFSTPAPHPELWDGKYESKYD